MHFWRLSKFLKGSSVLLPLLGGLVLAAPSSFAGSSSSGGGNAVICFDDPAIPAAIRARDGNGTVIDASIRDEYIPHIVSIELLDVLEAKYPRGLGDQTEIPKLLEPRANESVEAYARRIIFRLKDQLPNLYTRLEEAMSKMPYTQAIAHPNGIDMVDDYNLFGRIDVKNCVVGTVALHRIEKDYVELHYDLRLIQHPLFSKLSRYVTYVHELIYYVVRNHSYYYPEHRKDSQGVRALVAALITQDTTPYDLNIISIAKDFRDNVSHRVSFYYSQIGKSVVDALHPLNYSSDDFGEFLRSDLVYGLVHPNDLGDALSRDESGFVFPSYKDIYLSILGPFFEKIKSEVPSSNCDSLLQYWYKGNYRKRDIKPSDCIDNLSRLSDAKIKFWENTTEVCLDLAGDYCSDVKVKRGEIARARKLYKEYQEIEPTLTKAIRDAIDPLYARIQKDFLYGLELYIQTVLAPALRSSPTIDPGKNVDEVIEDLLKLVRANLTPPGGFLGRRRPIVEDTGRTYREFDPLRNPPNEPWSQYFYPVFYFDVDHGLTPSRGKILPIE